MAPALKTMTVDVSTESYLLDDDPKRLAYEDFRHQFGTNDIAVIEIEPEKVYQPSFFEKLRRFHFALEDLPYVGWLVSPTIGRLIKPPMYMHKDEWKEGGAVKVEDPEFGKTFATELGETPGGMPVSPYGVTQTISKAFYNLTEQSGLPGYAIESFIDRATGTPGIFDQYKVMSSFRDVTSKSRDYYDLGLGGQLMTNEAYRRLYPAERGHIDTYNPLRN